MNKIKIKVDVISDVVCPWCFIGKRRLEKAIDKLKDQYEIDLEFLPFELNPQMPKEGRNQKEYLSAKFGGEDRYHQITGRTTKVASEEGLIFDFEKQNVSPNTFDAHRLIWLAKKEGVQPQIKEALMKAYFEDGVDLSKKENLVEVVSKAGLDVEKATRFLNSEEGIAEVKILEQINYQRGISGVPFYIINNKYGVSGAQPSDVFIQVLTEAGKEMETQGEVCDVDGC